MLLLLYQTHQCTVAWAELLCPAALVVRGVLYFKCSLKCSARRKFSTFGQASHLLFAFSSLPTCGRRVVQTFLGVRSWTRVLSNFKLSLLGSWPPKSQGIRCLIHLQIETPWQSPSGEVTEQDWYISSSYGEIWNSINQMLLFALISHE